MWNVSLRPASEGIVCQAAVPESDFQFWMFDGNIHDLARSLTNVFLSLSGPPVSIPAPPPQLGSQR